MTCRVVVGTDLILTAQAIGLSDEENIVEDESTTDFMRRVATCSQGFSVRPSNLLVKKRHDLRTS